MWEDWKSGDGFNVGDKFSSRFWGHPDLPSSIVVEITNIGTDGIFSWKIIQPTPSQNPYRVGPTSCLSEGDGWRIMKLQRDYVYDQSGDTEEDI